MHRLLSLLAIVLVLTFLAVNFQAVKRELAYKLGVSGDTTTSCCNSPEVAASNGNFDESASLAFFNNQPVEYPKTSLAYQNQKEEGDDKVLGTTNSAGEEKWIEVSLQDQHLWAREGNRVVMDYPISSGLWSATPIGTFNIWYKTRYQPMIGGSKELGTYYNLPNVPNNMFFHQGYAIHGAYWHNNFGHPMSHGCVNEPLADAAAIFEWAGPTLSAGQNAIRASVDNPGTRVWVH